MIVKAPRTAAALLATLALAACGNGSQILRQGHTPEPNGVNTNTVTGAPVAPDADIVAHAINVEPVETVADLVRQSERAVLGRVLRVEREPAQVNAETGQVETFRRLHVRVSQNLDGSPVSEPELVVRDFGWLQMPGQPERVMRTAQQVRLETGNEVALFLKRDPKQPAHVLVAGEGSYRLANGRVDRDAREDKNTVVRRVQEMSVEELKTEVRQAKSLN